MLWCQFSQSPAGARYSPHVLWKRNCDWLRMSVREIFLHIAGYMWIGYCKLCLYNVYPYGLSFSEFHLIWRTQPKQLKLKVGLLDEGAISLGAVEVPVYEIHLKLEHVDRILSEAFVVPVSVTARQRWHDKWLTLSNGSLAKVLLLLLLLLLK